MQSPTLLNQQTSRDLVPSFTGATSVKRGLIVVYGFIVVGWTLALALLIVYALNIQGGVNLQGLGGGIWTTLAALVQGEVMLYMALGLALLPVLFLLIWRAQAVRRSVYRTSSGCPQCHDRDFLRGRRRMRERAASNLISLPSQRQICRNCGWEGLLIGSNLVRTTYAVSALSGQTQIEDTVGVTVSDKNMSQTQVNEVQVAAATTAVVSSDRAVEVDKAQGKRTSSGLMADVPDSSKNRKKGVSPAPSTSEIGSTNDNSAVSSAANADSTVPTQQNGIRSLQGTPSENSHASSGESESVGETANAPIELKRGVPYAVVMAPFGIKVRSAPRVDAKVLVVLPADATVRLIDGGNNADLTSWQQVFAEGTTGWVSCAYLRRLPNR